MSAPARAASHPLKALLQALRPHQWAKNGLLLVPALLAQVWTDATVAWQLLVALAAFCLAASGTYLVNDLVDLRADPAHPDKRHRPLASGALAPGVARLAAVVLLGGGLVLGYGGAGLAFSSLLGTYVILSLSYSAWFKRLLLVDVIVLAALYTLRLEAGGAAAGVEVSSWLLAFSLFFFLSLAFAKRYTEFRDEAAGSAGRFTERPYAASDLEGFRSVGPGAGMLSIVVLALYISGDAVQMLYGTPRVLWLLCPLLLYWVLRVWFIAFRGELHSDPIVFALKDRVSWAVVAGIVLVLLLAAR